MVAAARQATAALSVAATLVLGAGLAGCGDRDPFERGQADPPAASTTAPTTAPDVETSEPPVSGGGEDVPVPGGDEAPSGAATPEAADVPPAPTSPAEGAPGAPGDAPSPAGVRPDEGSKSGRRPRTLSQRVAADSTAKLNVRTMISVIEGCHSGRDTYKACNSHEELGSPTLLGLKIGKRRGQVQISATDNGVRITAHSMSGAKFTVARGPNGDRFKCIGGRMPGACPPDRTWTW